MVEDPQITEGLGASPLGDALEAGRRLLAAAEAEAARLRTEAQRHASRREMEAELLVAKARRLLEAAEARASVIVATARASALARADVVDLRGDADLAPRWSPRDVPRASRGDDDLPPRSPRTVPRATRFDSLLATAIANAVDDAFPDRRLDPQLAD